MAIGSLDSPFMRRSKSQEALTSFSSQSVSSPRGRPSQLTDAQLQNRRDQFVEIFEGYWGDIGWELQRCRKADDIIRIFTALAEPKSWISDVVIFFCHPSGITTGFSFRKLRGERRALVEQVLDADAARRLAQDRLCQVNLALLQVRGRNRHIFMRVRKLRRKEYSKAMQRYSELFKRESDLDLRLKDASAGFARLELFRFLKSKRYVLTPRALANAVAGLPYMGWRQSVKRSSKAPSELAIGSGYQIFKAMRYLMAIANRKTLHAFVGSFREHIPLLPSRYQLPKIELMENWWFLERAIRLAYRAKPFLKAFPFEITRLYFKQIRARTPVDTLLADQFKLGLSNQPKRVASSQPANPDTAQNRHDKIMKTSGN